MLELLLLWVFLSLVLIVVAIGRPGNGGALTLAYFIGLSLIHVPGVLAFVGSDLYLAGSEVTRLGFEMTVFGLAAFVAGAVLARHLAPRHLAPKTEPIPVQAQALARVGQRAFALGLVAYFVLIPLSFRVASLTSVVAAMATTLILGLWLMLYAATIANEARRIVLVLALLPLLPLATLTTGGFLGYGVYWVLSVVAFLFVIARKRILFYVSVPLVIYLGLSLFVTYIGQRTGIRDIVWQENSSMIERLGRVSSIVTQFQMLDLNSAAHLAAIDDRLNQNMLVGVAIQRHESGWSEFAYGATVPIWALIPRAIWPDKPGIGGGLEVVSDFTGIHFDETTSVGAGQVLEFYVNFGVGGLVIGFMFLGFSLMWLDQGIMRALAVANMRAVVLRTLPALTLLQPGGNLLEIFVAAAAALLGAQLILWTKFFDLPLSLYAQRGVNRPVHAKNRGGNAQCEDPH